MAVQPELYPLDQSNMMEVVDFLLVATMGSAAVASYFGKSLTFARNSAGNYTITLPKSYRKVVDFDPGWQRASGAELGVVIVSHTVDTNGQLVIECRNSSGTATEPASGDVLFLRFSVSDSPLNEKFGG